MKRKNLKGRTPLAIATTLLLVAIVGCSKAEIPTARSSDVGVAPVPAALKTSALTVNPAEAYSGVQVMVTAKVTNTGDSAASYTPRLKIDNVSEAASLPTYLFLKQTSIGAGATQQLSFVLAPENPGKYRVTWGEAAGEFAVIEDVVAPGSTTNVTAPDFTGVDVITGKKVSLLQLKGSVVLFNFVNYGCDPSVSAVVSKQLLAIKELQKQRSDFVPLSVFCGCCTPETLKGFAQQNGLSWPWLLDSDGSIARKYMPYLSKYGYPTLVLIDGNGNVRDVAGYTDTTGLAKKINNIIEQKG